MYEDNVNSIPIEIKALSISLNKERIDAIEYITNNKVHCWKRNGEGGLDLYYYVEIEK
jgi:hypothetical protein